MTHGGDKGPGQLVSFEGDAFAAAAPFGFVVDGDGDVVLLGLALQRRIDRQLPLPVADLFEDASPRKRASVEETLRAGRKLELRVHGTDIVLRGQSVPLAKEGSFAFMASPIVQSIEQLRDCGIQLRDFTTADSTPDLLISMQATKTALNDARSLGDKLRKSVAKAEAAVVAKSQFLAVMSHEIRTPMNGLGSMVDLLRESGLTDEQLELLTTIDDCSSTLGVLLDDVLDLSKVDANAVDVESIPFPLPKLIERVKRMFMAAADANSVELSLELSPELPDCVLGDPTRTRQVLSNLVSNAIKFSEGGKVAITAGPAHSGQVAITVSDTGVGISEEAQASLFQPFSQADSSTTRKFGGTGLGLSIARGLARAMGGDLVLEGSGPEGSRFKFLLRAPTADSCPTGLPGDPQGSEIERAQLTPAEIEERLSRTTILVADDNPVNLVVAGRLLGKLGAAYDTVDDGAKAVEAVKAKRYDLVLMDLMMPNMDGVTASRMIRNLDLEWSDIPIIAFTAGVIQSAQDEAMAAGMTDFLAKPVRLQSLREILIRHCT